MKNDEAVLLLLLVALTFRYLLYVAVVLYMDTYNSRAFQKNVHAGDASGCKASGTRPHGQEWEEESDRGQEKITRVTVQS